MRTFAALALAWLTVAPIARAGAPNYPPEVVDAKTVDAYKHFWNAYEEYEGKVLSEGQKQFRESWEEIKRGYYKERAAITADEIQALETAAVKYRKNLEEHPNADNRPYVMLNLAQILNTLGDQKAKGDADSGVFDKNEALGLLKDLAETYKAFPLREQAQYLRAVIFESLERSDDALAAWRALAATSQNSLYVLRARVAVGDHLFTRDRPGDAMRSYQKARALLKSVEAPDPDLERVRIDYRLAWAAYRATDLETVVDATTELLALGAKAKTTDQREKIRQDAVDLLGDSLYEGNSLTRDRDVLRRRAILPYAQAVARRTVKRYGAAGVHQIAATLGGWAADEFPLAAETPDVLHLTAASLDKLGKTDQRLATLEKLALLSPVGSLWRARHKDDLATIQAMEKAAAPAAELAANAHYDTGLASGNPRSFLAASSYYDILIEHAPNAPDANKWRLRRAHCQFFAGNLDEAARMYEALKKDFKVDPATLQVASYQLVLTHEKRWRDAFAKASEQSEDPLKDKATLAALQAMDKSIDEFAARFPGQTRAVDLLLVGAGANRDMNRLDDASRYWQRTLVSQPSPTQRGIAVRGLVYATMRTGSTRDVVELTRRFLKLEDWSALGPNLASELRGVLATATLGEGRRLGSAGQALEAGTLMVTVARGFTKVPQRGRIFRDGAYELAIAGEWGQAEAAAEDYFKAGLTHDRADMLYLLARAHEYQLRLHAAAKSYLKLGEKYPHYSRAATSLKRAEKLAVAEGDFALAAKAAATEGDQAKTEAQRLSNYGRASEYLNQDGHPDRALALARRRQRSSRTPAERLRSELLVERMTYKTGAEQEALDDLAITAKKITRARGRLARKDYSALASEAHFLLGEEAKRKFDDFRLSERGGSMARRISQKSTYFAGLVQEYDRAAAAGDPHWAAQARFQLASSAEAFADEIAGIPARTGQEQSYSSAKSYGATIDRLRKLARKYYSTNVMTANRDPARYRDNEWIKKSALRLTGQAAATAETSHRAVMPASVQDNLPLQWSL